MSISRSNGVGFSINGKGYIGVGQNSSGTKIYDFWEYDPVANSWTQKATYPGSGSYSGCGFSANGKGYICLGANGSGTAFADLYEYNPSTDKWTKKTSFPGSARYGASWFVINDTAYIIGGSTGGPPYLSDVWQYIPSTDVWTKKNNFPGGNRSHGIGFTIGSVGYCGTGLSNSSTATNDIWKYNKAKDSWTRIKDLPGSAIQSPVAFGLTNKGYLGTGYNMTSKTNDIYEYDVIDNTWTKMTNVPSGLSVRNASATFEIDGIGYLGTGSATSSPLPDLWSYTPVNFRRNCTNDSTYVWPLSYANLDSVKWNFGDSASGTKNISRSIKSAFHIYKNPGTYKVKLYTYLKGNRDSTTFTIPVKEVRPFIGNDTAYCNSSSFSKTLKPSKNYFKYKWNTGDSVKSITVKTSGTYILTVIDSVKCLVSDTITIRNPVVTSKFTRDSIICINNISLLKNVSIIKGDTLKSLLWKISDNSTFTDSIIKKSFSTADSFLVKLITYSKYGCKDSTTKKVYVNPNASIGFTINKTIQCYNGHDFVYTNSSTVSKGSITYNWNLGDATTSTSKNISTKTYSKDTTYLITLITTTDKGCKDTASKSVTINVNPKTTFNVNTLKQCFNYHNFNFTNSSTISKGSISSYAWNLGDSKTATTQDVSGKTYSVADSFKVQLLSVSNNGCRDSISKTVTVYPNAAIGFTINKTPQCFNGHDFIYTNTSTLSKGSLTYNWNLGDATSSTSKNISTKTYSKDTTYLITLISTTDKGCNDTITKTVTINANPKTVFSVNQLKQCFNYHSFNYTNSSTINKGTISSYTWNLGDSKTATTQNITGKTYSTADSFKVQLLAISNNGCRDSISKTVTVYPNAAIGFTINKTPQCFNGHDFVFTNTSSIKSGNFTNNWLFGDGTSATTKDVTSKKYIKDSTYLITLITTSDKGCNDTISKSITLYASPKASFAINAAKQCYKWNLFDFTNGSTIRTGSISQYAWDLGDADKRTTKNVTSKHYNTEDSFKVSILTVSNFGCRDSSSFTVNVLNTPQPNFTINKDTQCFNGHNFSFNNQTKIAAGNFTNRWEFGDLSTDTNKQIASKKYSVYGTYKVLLIATSNNNCKDSISKTIRINASPVTKFVIDKDRQCFRGNVFNYTNQSTIPQGTLTYEWALGESKKSTLKDILNHKYTTEDSFNIQLIATSDKFCKDTISHLAVTFAQPVAKFVVPQDSQCWQKHYFIIINNTTLKYGTLNHVWNFGDGTYDYTHTPATKRYANTSANYLLKYKVTSDHGCTDSAQKKVSLLERPISIFTINDSIQCFKTNNFSFVNKTTFSDLTTITYYWDYGDGSQTVGKNAKSLSYPSPKFYNVQLISSSYLNNCIDTLVRQIIVAPHAKPAFTIDKDSQCFRTNYFTFTNGSSVQFGKNKYKWQFGDNTSDTNTNTTKTYKSGSKYAVKLIATTNYNCKDSISKPIVLVPHPITKFVLADTTLCRSQNVNITNQSTLLYGNFTQVWHFDEGADETGLNVSNRKLITPGFHPIRLSLKSNFGCTDTLQKRVYVEQPGTTRISIVENDSQCLRGNSTHFNVTSLGGAIILNTYKWDFGDGNFSNIQNPVYSYLHDSSFKISVETSSSNNCLDTTYFKMVIHPHPTTDFTSTIPCFPNPVVFANNSKIKSGTIKSYLWTFGTNVNTSNLIAPVYNFPTDGSFNVKLKTTSNYGCTDSTIKSAVTKPKPKALFTYTKLPSPDDINLQMNNQSSSDVSTYNWDFSNGTFSNNENPIAVYTDSGRFYITLSVSNADGCSDTFSLLTDLYYPEFVFYVPTAFSPNGNGVNEIFKPNGSRFYRKYSMEIYNHWGEKMFETTDLNTGWDGTYKGVECPDGVYHCYIWIMPIKGSMRAYNSTLYLLK